MCAAGYGRVSFDGKVRPAHRVAYVLAYGPIPDSLHVLHRCDTPSCVKPLHLHVGSPHDNFIDRHRRSRNTPGLHPIRNTYDPATGVLTRNRNAPV